MNTTTPIQVGTEPKDIWLETHRRRAAFFVRLWRYLQTVDPSARITSEIEFAAISNTTFHARATLGSFSRRPNEASTLFVRFRVNGSIVQVAIRPQLSGGRRFGYGRTPRNKLMLWFGSLNRYGNNIGGTRKGEGVRGFNVDRIGTEIVNWCTSQAAIRQRSEDRRVLQDAAREERVRLADMLRSRRGDGRSRYDTIVRTCGTRFAIELSGLTGAEIERIGSVLDHREAEERRGQMNTVGNTRVPVDATSAEVAVAINANPASGCTAVAGANGVVMITPVVTGSTVSFDPPLPAPQPVPPRPAPVPPRPAPEPRRTVDAEHERRRVRRARRRPLPSADEARAALVADLDDENYTEPPMRTGTRS